MKIIVIICTYNRSKLLDKTLSRLAQINSPKSAILEYLIINNNCTDDTDQIVLSHKPHLPLSLASETKPGLSNARNKGITEALRMKADYIIWTDDDVLPDTNWLTAYENAFQRFPDAAVFGGTVEPWFETTPPRWLINSWDAIKRAFAVRELGITEFELTPDGQHLPFGANYAIKTSHHIGVDYDPKLGVIGNTRLCGEETLVIKQILSNNNSGWWIPTASVKHFLPKERLTLNYLWDYFLGVGASNSINNSYPGTCFLGIPLWMLRQTSKYGCLLIFNFLLYSPAFWIPYFRDFAVNIGTIKFLFNNKFK